MEKKLSIETYVRDAWTFLSSVAYVSPQMVTVAYSWHFQEAQNLLCAFPGYLVQPGILCFGNVSYGRLPDVGRSWFSLLCIVMKKIEICRGQGETAWQEETERLLVLFGEVSTSLQRVKWLFTEMRPSCFRPLMHLTDQKQPQLWWRVIEPNHWAKSWGRTERGQRREERDERKAGEREKKTSEREEQSAEETWTEIKREERS